MATRRRSTQRAARTPLERLRRICLALPETTEKIAWGEPTWRVRGHLFAQLDDHHHGADHLAVWLPAPLGEQEAMLLADPGRDFLPPALPPRLAARPPRRGGALAARGPGPVLPPAVRRASRVGRRADRRPPR